jgi:sialate O-acetylesterase
MKVIHIALIAVLCLGSISADAISLAPLFSEGVVLQRDQPLPVWGRAEPGEPIRVEFAGETQETITDASGSWRVTLGPKKMSTELRELVVTGNQTVRIRDVLVGDLWLCSGQSNMAFVVSRGLNAEAEIASADFPMIRHFRVIPTAAQTPAETVRGNWRKATPEEVGGFTGVGYFFARKMFLETGVPIGLLHASWGGTQIESWISAKALASDPSAPAIEERWQAILRSYPSRLAAYEKQMKDWEAAAAAAQAAGREFTVDRPRAPDGLGSRAQPSSLYNGMIAPFVPAALRGVLWYQGEANAPRPEEYASLFQGLIRQWRKDFGQELPFYFVQLANFDRGNTWPLLREAQQSALALPKTGMAVAIDIGEVDDVHPRNKQDVGRRLALIALAKLEGRDLEYSGPVFRELRCEGDTLRVIFDHGSGLTSHGRNIVSIEIAGANQRFVPAAAVIDGDTLLVSSPSVSEPVAVRYAWHNIPDARLYNGAGLPAVPFRSHPW